MQRPVLREHPKLGRMAVLDRMRWIPSTCAMLVWGDNAGPVWQELEVAPSVAVRLFEDESLMGSRRQLYPRAAIAALRHGIIVDRSRRKTTPSRGWAEGRGQDGSQPDTSLLVWPLYVPPPLPTWSGWCSDGRGRRSWRLLASGWKIARGTERSNLWPCGRFVGNRRHGGSTASWGEQQMPGLLSIGVPQSLLLHSLVLLQMRAARQHYWKHMPRADYSGLLLQLTGTVLAAAEIEPPDPDLDPGSSSSSTSRRHQHGMRSNRAVLWRSCGLRQEFLLQLLPYSGYC